MLRTSVPLAVSVLVVSLAAADDRTVQTADWADVDRTAELPADLTEPDGRTRWDLSRVVLGSRWTRTVRVVDGPNGADWIEDRSAGGPGRSSSGRASDPTTGLRVERWLLPERDPDLSRPAVGAAVELLRHGARGTERE